ncbi:hypothetical protein B9T64_05910 [Bacillus halotolerans]|nr:hypothetical protein B9T64_05910 [Bacillus halotolerans]
MVSNSKQHVERIWPMCTVGIGDNMLLSRLALDLESKKTKSGIARWRYEDVPNKALECSFVVV